jgi:hypothetical protein
MKLIEPTISIEELVASVPGAVAYLIERGLPCLVCGEPSWGTLEEVARDNGWTASEIEALVAEMNATLRIKEPV